MYTIEYVYTIIFTQILVHIIILIVDIHEKAIFTFINTHILVCIHK